MTLVRGLTDPCGAAKTWREKLGFYASTPSSSIAQYQDVGNPALTSNYYTFQNYSFTGIHGLADGSYKDVGYRSAHQLQPYINRPFIPGRHMFSNNDDDSTNPIAGSNGRIELLSSRFGPKLNANLTDTSQTQTPTELAGMGKTPDGKMSGVDVAQRVVMGQIDPLNPLSSQYANTLAQYGDSSQLFSDPIGDDRFNDMMQNNALLSGAYNGNEQAQQELIDNVARQKNVTVSKESLIISRQPLYDESSGLSNRILEARDQIRNLSLEHRERLVSNDVADEELQKQWAPQIELASRATNAEIRHHRKLLHDIFSHRRRDFDRNPPSKEASNRSFLALNPTSKFLQNEQRRATVSRNAQNFVPRILPEPRSGPPSRRSDSDSDGDDFPDGMRGPPSPISLGVRGPYTSEFNDEIPGSYPSKYLLSFRTGSRYKKDSPMDISEMGPPSPISNSPMQISTGRALTVGDLTASDLPLSVRSTQRTGPESANSRQQDYSRIVYGNNSVPAAVPTPTSSLREVPFPLASTAQKTPATQKSRSINTSFGILGEQVINNEEEQQRLEEKQRLDMSNRRRFFQGPPVEGFDPDVDEQLQELEEEQEIRLKSYKRTRGDVPQTLYRIRRRVTPTAKKANREATPSNIGFAAFKARSEILNRPVTTREGIRKSTRQRRQTHVWSPAEQKQSDLDAANLARHAR